MKILKLFISLALISALFPAMAGDLKVGWINIERIFREAGPAQKATKKLEKEFAQRDGEIQKLGKQTRDLQAQLDKDGMVF